MIKTGLWSSGGSTHCTCQLTALSNVTSLSVVSYDGYSAHASDKLHMYFLQSNDVVSHFYVSAGAFMSCIVLGTLRTTMTWVRVFL